MKNKTFFLRVIPVTILIIIAMPGRPAEAEEIPGESQPYAAPGAFNKSSPGDGAAGVAIDPLLNWTDSLGVAQYQYCIDTIINNSCDTTLVGTGTTSQKQLSGLSNSTQYEWQVVAINSIGQVTYANGSASAFWTFTTVGIKPQSFNKSMPSNGATGVSPSPILSWGSSVGANYYEYCYDTVNDGTCSGWTSAGADTNASLTGLSYSTSYYWQVRAINASGTTYANGSDSAFWTFTTAGPPPAAFDKLTPTSGTTGVVINPILDWQASAGTVEYWYCIDTNINNSCNSPWVSSGATHQVQLSGLNYSTQYEWQVLAQNTTGFTNADGSASAFWIFTTVSPPPGAFNKVTPANGATGVVVNPILDWQASASATEYWYCIDSTINNSCDSYWYSTGTTHQVQHGGLNYATQYEWQVLARNTTGVTYANGSESAFWTFTTTGSPPGAFNKLTPASGTTGVAANPILDWQASAGAAEYQYCYDMIQNGSCDNLPWISTGTTHQAQLSGLYDWADYEWQVKAVNATGTTFANGSASAFWNFTTALAPRVFNKLTPNDGATGVSTSLTLDWAVSPGTDFYQYCYDTTINQICDQPAWSNTEISQAQISGLSNLTLYEWHVKAISSTGFTAFADGSEKAFWTFTTAATSLCKNYLPLLRR